MGVSASTPRGSRVLPFDPYHIPGSPVVLPAPAPAPAATPSTATMAGSLLEACLFTEQQVTLGPQLGAGAYGAVFACTLNGSLPACAKGLPALYGLDPESRDHMYVIEELKKEALMLATLRHTNILNFYGVCLDDRRLPKWLLVELAHSTLSGYLRARTEPLTPQVLGGMWCDVLEGLAYLHGRKPAVIHQDLKPENLLVFVTRGHVTVKIGDVGLARLTDTAGHHVGSVGGSPFYAAPEVGLGGFDTKVDVFSVGMLMAEVIVAWLPLPGTVPRRVEYDMRTRFDIVDDAVSRLRCAGLTGPTEVLAGCCAKTAEARLSSQQALERLQTCLTAGTKAAAAPLSSNPAVRSPLPALPTAAPPSTSAPSSAASGVATYDPQALVKMLGELGLASYQDAVSASVRQKMSLTLQSALAALYTAGMPGSSILKVRQRLTMAPTLAVLPSSSERAPASALPALGPLATRLPLSQAPALSEPASLSSVAVSKALRKCVWLGGLATAELKQQHVEATMRAVTPALASLEVCEAFIKAVRPHFASGGDRLNSQEAFPPAVPALVSVLARHGALASRTLVLNTLQVLGSVSHGCHPAQAVAGEAGAVRVLVSVMEAHVADSEVLTASWETLASVVTCHELNQTRVGEGDLPARLLRVMTASLTSCSLTVAACQTLNECTVYAPITQARFCAAGAVDLLLDAMDTHPSDAAVSCACLDTLSGVALSLDAVALQRLYAASSRHSADKDVQMSLCGTLSQLAHKCTDRGAALVSSGAIEHVFGVLEGHLEEEDTVKGAITVLVHLLKFDEHAPRFLAGGGEDYVLAAMEAHAAHADIKECALKVLHLLSESEGRSTATAPVKSSHVVAAPIPLSPAPAAPAAKIEPSAALVAEAVRQCDSLRGLGAIDFRSVEAAMAVVMPALSYVTVCEALIKAVEHHFASYPGPQEAFTPAVPALVSILAQHRSSRALVLATAKVLQRAYHCFDPSQEAAGEAGAGLILVATLEVHVEDPEVLVASWKALGSVAHCCEPTRARISKGDLPARLLGVVAATMTSSSVMVETCGALGSVLGSTESRAAFQSAGALDLLLEMMDTHAKDAAVTAGCLNTLYCLEPKAVDAIRLQRMYSASNCHSTDADVQRELCDVLWMVTSKCADRGAALVSSGAFEQAVAVLDRHLENAGTARTAIVVFTYLLRYEEHFPRLLAGGALERVLAAMELHASYADLQDDATHLLQSLLKCEEGLSALRAAHGRVVRLVQLARETFKSHEDIVERSDAVLAKLR